jgi:hypothetical protein
VIGTPTLAALDPELGGEAAAIAFAIPSATVRDVATSTDRCRPRRVRPAR